MVEISWNYRNNKNSIINGGILMEILKYIQSLFSKKAGSFCNVHQLSWIEKMTMMLKVIIIINSKMWLLINFVSQGYEVLFTMNYMHELMYRYLTISNMHGFWWNRQTKVGTSFAAEQVDYRDALQRQV